MLKNYLFIFLFFCIAFATNAQGTESFTNLPTTPTPSSYIARTWTGDNGLTWTASDARVDGPTDASITGISGKFIIIRQNTGKVTCNGIPNGCGTVTFNYARAYSGSASIGLFINGTQVGATISITSNSALQASFVVNITGSFDFEIRQLTSGTSTRVAIDDVNWSSFNAPPCTEPTAQPTNLILSPTPTTISGTFTQIPDPTTVQNYLVVRSTSPTLSQLPQDGVTYPIGQPIEGGNGTNVGISSDGTFTDNVSPSTQYYYFIFAMNDQSCGGGPNYNQVNPLAGDITTPALPACTTPVSAPTNLALTPANTSIRGTFPGVVDANKYLVVISTSNSLSASPVNGTTYTSGQSFGGGTIVSFESATNFTAIGLTPATQYYLYVFAANSNCSRQPFYNTTALSGNTSTTNNTTGIPTGYYDAANGLTCQPLKTKLRDIVSTGYVQLTYTPGVWNAYQFTDIKRNDANTANVIWDIYSDNPTGPDPYTFTYGPSTSGGNQCGTYGKEGDCYNREHSTPKSWFADAYSIYTDINHLYPTYVYVNNIRNNYPYGEVTTATFTSLNGSKLGTGTNFGYAGTVFEPIDEFKGDLARTSLYMATRYENEIIANNWSANGSADALFLSPTDEPDPAKRKLQIYDAWYLKTLFKWMANDPVSQKEIDRNNAIYYQSGQNNRNPYIDHPEYAALVFQCTGLLPVTITNFTAAKNNEEVLLKWYATYETDFKQYEVERSINGINFNKIGQIAGRNLANYSYYDQNLPNSSVVYYRLKMIDIDGKYSYSKTLAVKLNNNLSNAIVYPNPANASLNIKLLQVLAANSSLQVTDIAGRIVMQKMVSNGTINFPLDVKSLPSGRYFIKIQNTHQLITQSFVVIK